MEAFIVGFAVKGINRLKPSDFCGFEGHLGAPRFFLSLCPQLRPQINEIWGHNLEQNEIPVASKIARNP